MRQIYTLLSLCVVASLSACSFTGTKQMYRPAGENPPGLLIDATISIPYVDIFVNGQRVIHGYVTQYPGMPEFVGMYKDKKVMANCHMHRGFFGNDFDCDVFVNDEFATNIAFK